MISVIIPLYNAGRYVDDTLESVLLNDVSDLEIILVDDGSTDDTYERCAVFASKEQRIRLFRQENRGVSAARNRGIELSKGDYLAFIDGDDCVDRDYLSVLMRTMETAGSDWVACPIEKKGRINRSFSKDVTIRDGEIAEKLRNSLFYVRNGVNLFSAVAGMYRASVIKDNGLRFNEGISYGEDILFNYELIHHIRSFSYVDRPLYHYRDTVSSLTNKVKDGFIDEVFSLFEEVEKIRTGHGEEIFREELCYMFMQILTIFSKKTFRNTEKKSRLADYGAIEERLCKGGPLQQIYERMKPFTFRDHYDLLLHLFKKRRYEDLYRIWFVKNRMLTRKQA